MDKEIIMKKSLLILLLIAPLSGCFNPESAAFSYRALLKKHFVEGVGAPIPVTIDRSIERDGSVSPRHLHFYYSSNIQSGNYDIYLRDLSGITTVRLTSHPARDISPVISPRGKRLAFVSYREDPEGDIYIVSLDSDDLIEKREKRRRIPKTLDAEIDNLTSVENNGTVQLIADENPSWSPDGKRIVFSSSRSGNQEIWIMDRNGSDKEQISTGGGTQPSFSPDGQYIAFISYRDSAEGALYRYSMETRETERISKDKGIYLNPVFIKNGSLVAATHIAKDTNKDGELNLKDHSRIILYDLEKDYSYPLTMSAENALSPRWFPAYTDISEDGIIVYSSIADENVNLNLLPASGTVPKRGDAQVQYEMANSYRFDYNDPERHRLALDLTWYWFAEDESLTSHVYVTKALLLSWFSRIPHYREKSFYLTRLDEAAEGGNPYAALAIRYLNESSRNKRLQVLSTWIDQHRDKASSQPYMPYVMEDYADELASLGQETKALAILRALVEEHSHYRRKTHVYQKISEFEQRQNIALYDDDLQVLLQGRDYQIRQKTDELLARFRAAGKNRHTDLQKLLEKIDTNNPALPVIHFAIAESWFEDGQYGNFRTAIENSISTAKDDSYMKYIGHIALADAALEMKKIDDTAKALYDGLVMYRQEYNDRKYDERVDWLVSYYRRYGQRSQLRGDFSGAVQIYKRYSNLMSAIQSKSGFDTLYNRYAARAHILYIEALHSWKGSRGLDEAREEYENGLSRAQLNFDKAHIYGLAYLEALKAIEQERKTEATEKGEKVGYRGLTWHFKTALSHIDWSLFLDDTFVEPYILKSWIHQYIDMRRSDPDAAKRLDKEFPQRLWESNIDLLERALAVNDESKYPEKEGSLHLNMANNYYLLSNYPRALQHYKRSVSYRPGFSSKMEAALFYYHYAYSYWQNGNITKARDEMKKAFYFYNELAGSGGAKTYPEQFLTLYKYRALFSRAEGKYEDAIKWYSTMLRHSAETGVKADRARIMQEIAACYYELEDFDAALSWLQSANRLLERQEDDSVDYDLTLKIFGFGPFGVWDMGADTAIIGDSRIITALNRDEKKLLNLSLLGSIHARKGNFRLARTYLQKKLELLKESSQSLMGSSRVITLNNLGYYSYYFQENQDARKYFLDAWNAAIDEDIRDLRGAYTVIINLSSFYAAILEEGSYKSLNDTAEDIKDLIEEVEDYKRDYSKERLEQQIEQLKQKYRAQEKGKVPDEEIEAIRKQIAQETAEVNFQVEIALGILTYYQGLLFEEDFAYDADEKSKEHSKLAKLYVASLNHFSTALKVAEQEHNYPLQARLHFNMASSLNQLGSPLEAMDHLKAGRDIAEKFNLRELLLAGHSRMAAVSKSAREKIYHLEKSRQIAEDLPFAYLHRSSFIELLYFDLASVYITDNKFSNALEVLESRDAMTRLIEVARLSPKFSTEQDYETYRRVLQLQYRKEETYDAISQWLLQNPDNNTVPAELTGKINAIDNEIAGELRKAEHDRIRDYCVMPEISTQQITPLPYIRLFRKGKTVHLFSLSQGRVTHSSFTDAPKPEKDSEESGSFLSRFIPGSDDTPETVEYTPLEKHLLNLYPRAVLALNNESYSLISSLYQKKEEEEMPLFSFIPSLDRIADVTVSTQAYIGRGGTFNKELNNLKSETLIVEDDLDLDDDLSPYALLADENIPGELTTEFLFNSRKSAPVLILRGTGNSIRPATLSLYYDAARYRGATAILFFRKSEKDLLESRLPIILEKGVAGSAFAGTGSRKAFAISASPSLESELYTKYRQRLIIHDTIGARIALERWYDLTGKEKPDTYLFEKAILSHVSGDPKATNDFIEKAIDSALDAEKSPQLYYLFQIYLSFYRGNTEEGANLMQKYAMELENTPDHQWFEALLELHNGKKPVSNSLPQETLLHINRYRLLFAATASVIGGDSSTYLEKWNADYPMPPRDMATATYLGNTIKPQTELERLKRITGLLYSDTSITVNSILNLAREEDTYDSLSPFPLLAAGDNTDTFIFLQSLEGIDVDSLIEKSFWIEKIHLQRLLLQRREFQYEKDRISLSKKIADFCAERDIPSLTLRQYREHIELLSDAKEYRDAKEYISRSEELLPEGSSIPLTLRFMKTSNLIALEQREEARQIISELSEIPSLTNTEQLLLALYDLRIQYQELRDAKQNDLLHIEWKYYEDMLEDIQHRLSEKPEYLSNKELSGQLYSVSEEYILYLNNNKRYSSILSHLQNTNALQDAGLLKDTQGQTALSSSHIKNTQEKLSYDTAIVVMKIIDTSLYFWTVTHESIEAGKIENVEKLEPLQAEFEEKLKAQRSIISISQQMTRFFKPMLDTVSEYPNLLFYGDTGSIPMELLGEEAILQEEHRIFFLAKLVSTSQSRPSGKPENAVITGASDTIFTDIERTALHQGGYLSNNSDFTVLQSPLHFQENLIMAGKEPLRKITGNYDTVYLSQGNGKIDGAFLTRTTKPCVYISGNTAVRDINSGRYLLLLFDALKKGEPLMKATDSALTRLRTTSRFVHPAYWQGIRVYVEDPDIFHSMR